MFLQYQLEMDEATLQVQRELLGAAAAISSGVVPLDVYRDLEARFGSLQTKFDAQKLETSRLEKQVASTTALVQVGFKVRRRTFARGRVAVEKDRSPKRDWIDEGNVAAHGGDVVADIQYFDQLDTSHGFYVMDSFRSCVIWLTMTGYLRSKVWVLPRVCQELPTFYKVHEDSRLAWVNGSLHELEAISVRELDIWQ